MGKSLKIIIVFSDFFMAEEISIFCRRGEIFENHVLCAANDFPFPFSSFHVKIIMYKQNQKEQYTLKQDLRKKNTLKIQNTRGRRLTAALLALTLVFSSGAGVFAADSAAAVTDPGAQIQPPAAEQPGTGEVTDPADPVQPEQPVKPVRPTISAKSGIVIDGDTGKILYSKNPHTKRDPLSTTKLLTCLIALEHLKLDQTVTVTQAAVNVGAKIDGSNVDLKVGE